MKDNIDIKLLDDEGPIMEIATFLNDALPFSYSPAVYQWEYAHHKSTFGYLQTTAGKIVGAQGIIPIDLNINGKPVLTGKSETSYLAPETKGKGLFKKLYYHVIEANFEKDIPLIWGFTSLGSYWKKLGFNSAENNLLTYSLSAFPTYQFYVSNPEQQGNLVKKWGRYFKAIADARKLKKRLKQFVGNDKKNIAIESSLHQQNDLVDYFNRYRETAADLIHLELHENYLNYRLRQNPFLNYEERYFYDQSGILKGYYFFSQKNGTGHLADFHCSDKTIQALMMGDALNVARQYKASRLNFFGNKLNKDIQATFNLFSMLGAVQFDTGMSIVSLAKDKHEPELKNWYINGLWTEGIDQ